MTLSGKNILLVISGGIAAYKALELIRLYRKAGADVRGILTGGGQQFITPMSVAALTENKVYTDLWSLKDESEMGHIRLSRDADLVVIAPASANIMAKMAHGLADDLASTALLAANKNILIAPAMNCEMWDNPATQYNIDILSRRDDIRFVGPAEGETACGETGSGRMAEPEDIFKASQLLLNGDPLHGYKALVTSGPTYEPIDTVRFIGNRSSGKQGHAIAQALADKGADVTLVTGPVSLPDPKGVTTRHINTAAEMYSECENALPADIAICAAAVADIRPAKAYSTKLKKGANKKELSTIELTENPDILQNLSKHPSQRPACVIGFAAETDNHLENGQKKLLSKGCDALFVNDVSDGAVFGEDVNSIICLSHNGENIEKSTWELDTKQALAQKCAEFIVEFLQKNENGIEKPTKESLHNATAE